MASWQKKEENPAERDAGISELEGARDGQAGNFSLAQSGVTLGGEMGKTPRIFRSPSNLTVRIGLSGFSLAHDFFLGNIFFPIDISSGNLFLLKILLQNNIKKLEIQFHDSSQEPSSCSPVPF